MENDLQKHEAEIGIIGGSGFYEMLENPVEIEMIGGHGAPSDKISLGEIHGRKVAFLPRHGRGHKFPPHKIPFKANIQALKDLGVKQIISPCAVGSLKPEIKPGDFVFPDQFVDRTYGRDDTFYHGPEVIHISGAEPYCPDLREVAIQSAKKLKYSYHSSGTIVVIQGPRFSTRSESKWFSSQGWDIVGMTNYPESVLARELEMCYLTIGLVTDYDVGLEGRPEIKPVLSDEVIRIFNKNIVRVKKLIDEIIANLPEEGSCECRDVIQKSRIN